MRVGSPECAYLSACHTIVRAEESPDEVIHLTSVMQFSGSRSVIQTVWMADGGQTNKITICWMDLVAWITIERALEDDELGSVPLD